jgi:hypothetical protein
MVFGPSLQVFQKSATSVGVTPEPCTGVMVQTLSPLAELNPFLNGKSGVTIDGTLVYQINEARVGPDGQAVNKYLNHPGYPNAQSAMPYVWSVIQFDVNGNLQPFNNGSGAVTTTTNLALFPTIFIYRNSFLQSPSFSQGSLDVFTPLDNTYTYTGKQ